MGLILPLALKFTKPTFPELAIAGTIYSTIVDSNNDNYIFGTFETVQGNFRYNAAKISVVNALDGGFGLTDILGDLYCATSAYDISANMEVFYVPSNSLSKIRKTDGTIINSTTQTINGIVYKILSDIDNTGLFIRGTFNQIGAIARSGIAKMTQAMTLVTTWYCNPAAGYSVSDMELCNTTSHLYVVGNFPSIRGVVRKFIARIRKDTGAVDTTFNANTAVSGMDSVHSLCVLADDSIIVAGTTGSATSVKILRISSTGSVIWQQIIATTSPGPFYNIIVKRHKSNIFIYYTSTQTTSIKYGTLANYTSGGTLNTSFNSPSGYISLEKTSSLPPIIKDIGMNSLNQFVIGGSFDKINNTIKTNYSVLSTDATVIY